MRAGEDHGVDPVTVLRFEHRQRGRFYRTYGHFIPRELCLGEFDKLGRAMTNDRAVGRGYHES